MASDGRHGASSISQEPTTPKLSPFREGKHHSNPARKNPVLRPTRVPNHPYPEKRQPKRTVPKLPNPFAPPSKARPPKSSPSPPLLPLLLFPQLLPQPPQPPPNLLPQIRLDPQQIPPHRRVLPAHLLAGPVHIQHPDEQLRGGAGDGRLEGSEIGVAAVGFGEAGGGVGEGGEEGGDGEGGVFGVVGSGGAGFFGGGVGGGGVGTAAFEGGGLLWGVLVVGWLDGEGVAYLGGCG